MTVARSQDVSAGSHLLAHLLDVGPEQGRVDRQPASNSLEQSEPNVYQSGTQNTQACPRSQSKTDNIVPLMQSRTGHHDIKSVLEKQN